jgi:hypothetical protein
MFVAPISYLLFNRSSHTLVILSSISDFQEQPQDIGMAETFP